MKRILVIGNSGAGKSTTSIAIENQLGLPVVHLDSHAWTAATTRITPEGLDQKLRQITRAHQWVIDGNYTGSLRTRLKRADTVVFLDLPRWQSFSRVVTRYVGDLIRGRAWYSDGRNLIPLGPHAFRFLRWVWRFNRDTRPKLEQILSDYPEVTVIRLVSQHQVNSFVASLAQKQGS